MKKPRRVVLGVGRIYFGSFARDNRDVSLEPMDKPWEGSMPLKVPMGISGKKTRLVAEVLE